MIIDFHTHVFPDELAERAIRLLCENIEEIFTPVTDGTLAGLVGYMDVSGIDISVLQPVVTKPKQFQPLNDWAASIQSARIVSFGGIYPHTDDYKRDIDYVVSLGLKGLKFHCEYQDFYVDAPEMLRIYDYAFSRGLIVLHHAGLDPAYGDPPKSSPKRFAAIADAMRGGTLVAAHLGGWNEWDDVERWIVGKNIYLDTSTGFEHFPTDQFLRIVENHGADKILFASDSPWSDAVTELQCLRALPLSEDSKNKILGANAQKLLGL